MSSNLVCIRTRIQQIRLLLWGSAILLITHSYYKYKFSWRRIKISFLYTCANKILITFDSDYCHPRKSKERGDLGINENKQIHLANKEPPLKMLTYVIIRFSTLAT